MSKSMPMRGEKDLLLPTKRPDQIRPIDSPATQGIPCCFMAPNQFPVLFKADPMAIKELVDVGGEQKPVGT